MITAVGDGSQAAEAGLEVGDVIESAAGVPLSSVAQLAQIASEAKRTNQTMRLIIRRGNQRSLLPLRIQ